MQPCPLLKVRRGRTTCRWVGVDARDVRRGIAFGPEPNVDVIEVHSVA